MEPLTRLGIATHLELFLQRILGWRVADYNRKCENEITPVLQHEFSVKDFEWITAQSVCAIVDLSFKLHNRDLSIDKHA